MNEATRLSSAEAIASAFEEADFDSGYFMKALETLAAEIHQTSVDKGWWDTERNDGEMIALIHSELSEGLENIRDGCPPDKHLPHFRGIEVEMADTMIRILDMCYARGWRLAEAVLAKAEYNKTREHRHGGRLF